MALYHINKGINRPVEFKGLKAQYIAYLGVGLVLLLVGFTVLYLIGVEVILCMVIISASGSWLFYKVFKFSHRYGEHGLMKKRARQRLPEYIRFHTRRSFLKLKKDHGDI